VLRALLLGCATAAAMHVAVPGHMHVVAATGAYMRRRPLRAAAHAMMMGDAEQEAAILEKMTAMRRRGMTDEQILEAIATEELFGTGVNMPAAAPPELPRSGGEAWGSWSQTDESVYLELNVAPDTPAKQVAVAVQVGFLDVRVADDPLLSGRLALDVLSDVEWALDVGADGQKVLCVSLQKRRVDAVDAQSGTALFSSLRVHGSEVGAPGLVSGVYLDENSIGRSREAEDAAYGTFDGSVPDQRGGATEPPLPLL